MNTVQLIGRLTNTPELKQTPNGKSVCNFSVAVERKFKDADGKPVVDFIDCVAWGNQADFICKWFDKGVRIGITGEIQTRSWKDNDDKSRKVVEILVNTVEFADGKREANINITTTADNSETDISEDDFTVMESDGVLPFN